MPIVIGVWVITVLVAVYTCAILPWFLDYYDFYQQNTGEPTLYPVAVRLFHQCYPVGIAIGLVIIGYGVHLLRPPGRRVDHIAWFASVSLGIAGAWFLWILLVERNFYVLLFPA